MRKPAHCIEKSDEIFTRTICFVHDLGSSRAYAVIICKYLFLGGINCLFSNLFAVM